MNIKTSKYYDFVNFIKRKYSGHTEPIVRLPFKEESNDKEYIRENADIHADSIRIPFDSVEKQSETFYKILEFSYKFIKDFQYSLCMLDILMKEHKDKKTARNFMFNTLNKDNSLYHKNWKYFC